MIPPINAVLPNSSITGYDPVAREIPGRVSSGWMARCAYGCHVPGGGDVLLEGFVSFVSAMGDLGEHEEDAFAGACEIEGVGDKVDGRGEGQSFLIGFVRFWVWRRP